jgi:hypothetical protein
MGGAKALSKVTLQLGILKPKGLKFPQGFEPNLVEEVKRLHH